jgi:hypothetical protein
MRIYVKNLDYGWDEPVSVQVLENGIVMSCNHDGAVENEVEWVRDFADYRGEHIQEYGVRKLLECRCGAWKEEWEEDWHER